MGTGIGKECERCGEQLKGDYPPYVLSDKIRKLIDAQNQTEEDIREIEEFLNMKVKHKYRGEDI